MAAMELPLKELYEENGRLMAMCIRHAALKWESIRRHSIILLAAI